MPELAEKNDNVQFVDLHQNLEDVVPDRLGGGRLIMDMMHPTKELDGYIAREILTAYLQASRAPGELLDASAFENRSVWESIEDTGHYHLRCGRY